MTDPPGLGQTILKSAGFTANRASELVTPPKNEVGLEAVSSETGTGGNKRLTLVGCLLLGWLGPGWGFEKITSSSDGSSLALGGVGLTVVLLKDVEVAIVGSATGSVTVGRSVCFLPLVDYDTSQ